LELMRGPLELRHLGHERVIGSYLLETDDGPALQDCGPTTCVPELKARLAERGLELADVRHLLLSHIHLDHAGAAGVLVREHPGLQVHVSEVGAPHVVDPSRLERSARRLYGDDFDRLWGEVVPVPEVNVKVLRGGERERGFRVAYTPGHASHHVSYLHEATGLAVAGDVAGVRIDGGPTLAPTPPPEIDVEAWHDSVAVLREWDPAALAITHFGTFDDVSHQLDALEESLDLLAAKARDSDAETFTAWVRERIVAAASPEVAAEFLQAMPPETMWPGLDRYWSKRAEAY
jgi:glyoxylase-like metal-dependent hydrolase (beta-lactamase superfamily II)